MLKESSEEETGKETEGGGGFWPEAVSDPPCEDMKREHDSATLNPDGQGAQNKPGPLLPRRHTGEPTC